jgi:hypothetical protein
MFTIQQAINSRRPYFQLLKKGFDVAVVKTMPAFGRRSPGMPVRDIHNENAVYSFIPKSHFMRSFCIKAAAAFLLFASATNTHAQSTSSFEAFANTKDSLMNMAYYDKNMPEFRRQLMEVMAGYNKLDPKEKEQYKDWAQTTFYNAACLYSQAGDKMGALENLERSQFYDYAHMQQDPDLDNIRRDPRFMRYLDMAKRHKSKYMMTLMQGGGYNMTEPNDLPAFTYQSGNDARLGALKKAYNLDSIAGNGNDISRMINLMEWVHYLVPHDGSKGNPDTKNAMSFIKECKGTNKSLNCRGLAITLNEVYLAAGFASRFVTCMPKDTTDQDCHVINVVWSTSLQKWVWMDPTFMAYVMNEEGEPLSIEEVRERLVTNRRLILNPDANRNHAASQTKADYLENYMAKNLYKLECPVGSEYNYETREKGKVRNYVQLLPGMTHPEAEVVKNEHGVESYKLTYTNNPKSFWAAPPASVTSDAMKQSDTHTKEDYEKAMARFRDCYNGKGECGADILVKETADFWKGRERKMLESAGIIKSYKFLGMEEDNKNENVALFKVVCDKSTHCFAFSLGADSKMETLRFQTTSGYINWLMAKDAEQEKKKKK